MSQVASSAAFTQFSPPCPHLRNYHALHIQSLTFARADTSASFPLLALTHAGGRIGFFSTLIRFATHQRPSPIKSAVQNLKKTKRKPEFQRGCLIGDLKMPASPTHKAQTFTKPNPNYFRLLKVKQTNVHYLQQFQHWKGGGGG